MMLNILVWISYAFYVAFGGVCLATGLYVTAEFIEEHTILTKRVLKYSIGAVFSLRVALWIFEGLPLLNTLIGQVSLVLYYIILMKHFPFIELTNPKFLGAIVLSGVDHFVWFRYFHVYQGFTFAEILAYFALCVWLIPFAFFISLSSNDNFLPGINLGDGGSGASWRANGGGADEALGTSKPRMRSVNRLLAIFNFLRKKRQEILPSSVLNVKAL